MISKETREKLVMITNLAVQLNSTRKNTCFITFAGHVQKLRVDIHYNGWKANHSPDFTCSCYLDSRYANECLIRIEYKLKELLDE